MGVHKGGNAPFGIKLYIYLPPSHAGKLSPLGNVGAWEGAGGGPYKAFLLGRRDGGGAVGTAGQ